MSASVNVGALTRRNVSDAYRCTECHALVADDAIAPCRATGSAHVRGQAYEIAAEADRIETIFAALTVEEAWWGCNSALDDARTTRGTAEQHHYLVRLTAWALVGLRAEAREQAVARGGGRG